MWSLLELVSVMPVILYRIYIPMLLGYTVVAERYIVDTIVTIAYYTGDLGLIKSQIAWFLLHFIPKDAVLIYLDSDYSVIVKRRGRVTDAYDFIEFQKTGYRIIGIQWKRSLSTRQI
jgi:hypothetical protein